MSSTFTPTNAVDMSKEKDWPANIGMLDWDSTSIVFTKRSLLEFLKQAGTTVDPNFTNIAKLPRYAKFGKLSAASNVTAESDIEPLQTSTSSPGNATEEFFKPSRRVRTAPGGPQSNIFDYDNDGDALSLAPPKIEEVQPLAATATTHADLVAGEDIAGSSFKPSRRVRTTPGGTSSMANFWDPAEPDEFKPTRRVRQGPGGQDHINGIF